MRHSSVVTEVAGEALISFVYVWQSICKIGNVFANALPSFRVSNITTV